MKVGYWLDWNSDTASEMEEHTMYLQEVVFDGKIVTPVEITHWTQVERFDGDLLTFDYGGMTGGYGPNPIVPELIRGVKAWCRKNPDRLALIWCTFKPEYYLEDFKANGGKVPDNLRCWHYTTHDAVDAALREFYKDFD